MISRILLISTVVLIGGCLFMFLGWWTLLLAIPLFKRHSKRFTAFGTARWATASDLDLNAKGLLIGRLWVNPRSLLAIFNPWVSSVDACKAFWGKRESPLIRLPSVVHTAIFAPTGVGKDVSFVIPHGRTCEENSIFMYTKNGEVALATMKDRKKMGHRIVLLDAHRLVTDTPDTLNPLDFIDASNPLAIDYCRSVAEALVIRSGQEREPHWNDASEMFIGGVTGFVVQHAPPEDRSLQTVRDILANPEELAAAITVMRQSDAWDGMLARMGNQLTHFKDKELGSVLTSVGRHLRFLDSPAIAESTKRSTFDPSNLLSGKMDIYEILPAEQMRTQSAIIRLWTGCFIRTVIQGGLSNRRIHLILNEANSLGHMDQLSDALAVGRGYGLRMQWYYQDVGQLKKCWPDGADQTLMANCTQVFFGVQDLPTATYVSDRLGEGTIVVESGGTSVGRSRSTPDYGAASASLSRNSNDNWSQSARKLLKPEEVLGLDERQAITFTPGLPPILSTLTRYYENKESRWKWLAHVKMFFNCLGLFIAALIVVLALLGINIHQHVR